MKLRLYNYWRSSASYRVRIALNWKGLAWEYVPIDITRGGPDNAGEQKAPDYRAKNAMMQVPTLEVTDADESVHLLAQSLPILEFLEERHPIPPLYPSDPWLRARARALAEIVNSGIQPLQNLTTTKKLKALGVDEAIFVRHFIVDGLHAFAAACADTAGRFCIGNEPSIADCALVPQLYSARRFGASLDGLELLVRIEEACNALPAFADAHPDRQPDARHA